jgi:hypothetical protein
MSLIQFLFKLLTTLEKENTKMNLFPYWKFLMIRNT